MVNSVVISEGMVFPALVAGKASRLIGSRATVEMRSGPARDGDLVARCLGGDLNAFDTIVERYRVRVVGLTTRMLGDLGRGEEMAQEAFLRAFTRLALYDPSRPFHSWLFRIAVNLSLNQLQSDKAAPPVYSLTDEGTEKTAAAPEMTPHEIAEQHELQRRVRTAILSLPAQYRAAVLMRYVGGLDYSEISESLQIPIGTVKTHLFRAKELLREKLRGVM